MGFAFMPNDGATLRDAFQKQFPEYTIDISPERPVCYDSMMLHMFDSKRRSIARNTFEAAMHLDSCVISGDLYVVYLYKNQGIAQRMMQAKIQWANKQHYTLLATIRDHNKVQKHILTKFGWVFVGNDLWAYTPIEE